MSSSRPMHVVFASVGYAELLGIESMSAVLKRAGHEVHLVHDAALFDDRFDFHFPKLAVLFSERERVIEEIVAHKPDLLGFSAITSTFAWALDIAREVKKRIDVKTIFGGVHVTAAPAFAVSYPEIDFVCDGEGEPVILALVEALRDGGDVRKVPGLWTKAGPPSTRPPAVDLAALPQLDKELYAPHFARRGQYQTMTGRGCPFACSFCHNSNARTRVRRRPIEHVMEELVHARARFDFRAIEFHDDIFTFDEDWLFAFLDRFKKEVDRPFGCQIHPKFISPRVAEALADAKCFRAKMGVQTLADKGWKTKNIRRAETDDDVAIAIDTCRAAGLRIEVDHIIGFPGEAPNALDYALQFYAEHTPGRIGTYWLTYFPGTEMTRKALAAGIVSQEEHDKLLRGESTTFHSVKTSERVEPSQQKRLEGFATAFQVLPLLPRPVRRRLDPETLSKVPQGPTVARWVQAAALVAGVAKGRGQDAMNYVRYYEHHLKRRALGAATGRASSAS